MPGETVLTAIETLIDGAIARINSAHGECPEVEITLPHTLESSFDPLNDLGERARTFGLPKQVSTKVYFIVFGSSIVT